MQKKTTDAMHCMLTMAAFLYSLSIQLKNRGMRRWGAVINPQPDQVIEIKIKDARTDKPKAICSPLLQSWGHKKWKPRFLDAQEQLST